MLELIFFAAGTAAIILISMPSLRAPGSHGFYRFFAWELILVSFSLNMRGWFRDPFSPHQLVSWGLLVASLALVLPGMLLLHRWGRPSDIRGDDTLIGFEKTTTLVTNGLYSYIRHPLYSSLIFLGWGIFFKHPSWIGFLLAAAVSVFLLLTAQAEERENIQHFGNVYQVYMQHTKRFVPFIW